jgi:hypothetical protein
MMIGVLWRACLFWSNGVTAGAASGHGLAFDLTGRFRPVHSLSAGWKLNHFVD